jgi:hypothetical protein
MIERGLRDIRHAEKFVSHLEHKPFALIEDTARRRCRARVASP